MTADDDPRPGVPSPTPRERYRFPVVDVVERELGPLDDDHLRVRMLYAGVCGSDLHLVTADPDTGYVMSSVPASIPGDGRVLGHEGVGQIIGMGANVTGLDRDDLVVFASIVDCGRCRPCVLGAPNQCESATLIGMQSDGLYADIADVPARLAHRAADGETGLDGLQALAVVEPAANAYLACETGEVGPDDTVVVFGAGPLGLLSAMVSRQWCQAARVIVVEPQPGRRELAAPWADEVLDVEEFFAGDEPIDVAIEASGDLSNVSRVMTRVRARGRVVLLGRAGEALVVNEVDHLITAAIAIRGSRGHLGGAIDAVMRLHADGTLPLGEVITGVLSNLGELRDQLRHQESLRQSHGKVVVRLGELTVRSATR